MLNNTEVQKIRELKRTVDQTHSFYTLGRQLIREVVKLIREFVKLRQLIREVDLCKITQRNSGSIDCTYKL